MPNETGIVNQDFVIQRASETLCEWWTGSGWSDNWEDAWHFSDKPDVSKETGDESAKCQPVDNANVTEGAKTNGLG